MRPLLKVLDDEGSNVRASVAWVLRHFDDPRVSARLIETLRDHDEMVIVAVAVSLGYLKTDQAVEPLIATLSNEDMKVRDRAARSLRCISGEDFGQNVDQSRSWYKGRQQLQSP